MKALKTFFGNPFRVSLTLGGLVLIFIIVVAVVTNPATQNRDHRIYKTGRVYTVQHDGHLFVLFNGNNEGGILHHPSCSHSECSK